MKKNSNNKTKIYKGWYYAKDGSVKTVIYKGDIKTIAGQLPHTVGFSAN